eukprot:TRINITY_DN22104_c0_g1_i1.p1 TRINITY_DN22104_c0_g1~~TRINITY_DN22104_c0_g1_i1.p1  ORF type:complete len:194 (+),score=23.00 TRINITY_DN22104_c0_g1_i1:29-610(+)
MSWLWHVVDRCTVRYPMPTKVVVAGVLTAVADVTVQKWAEGAVEVDEGRTGRMMAWRMGVHTPIAHHWFNFLDRALGAGTSPMLVAKKVALDQCVASPLVHLLFLPFMSFLEGKGLEDAYHKLTTTYTSMMLTSFMYWPFAHLLTFGLVPLRHRVLFVSCAGMLWMGVLSSYNNVAKRQSEDALRAPAEQALC